MLPSTFDLLLPNFNIFTIVGIVVVLLGIAVLRGSAFTKKFGLDISKYGSLLVLLGIVMVWGVSIVQDFLETSGGQLIFWGTIIVAVLGFVLFYDPKRGKRK